jgi:alpha-tubulin suppressor-like RCC1 family protein
LRGIGAAIAAVALILSGCGGGGDTSPGESVPREDPKVRIDSPTTGPALSVAEGFVQLAGRASIDAYNASDWAPKVRWSNQTAGVQGEASESVEWVWFFHYYPTNHQWAARVPLAGGSNRIVVEAYYPGGSVVGADTIIVTAPPDTTPPSVDITLPGTQASVTVRSASIDIGGVADDDRWVRSVEWRNTSTGASGAAAGTGNWSATIPLVPGENALVVTARDGEGNVAQASIVVFFDTTMPGLAIESAVLSAVNSARVDLAGTAVDAGGLARVTWRNATNGTSGDAEGTTSWMAHVPVQLGSNAITITATDVVGNTETISTSFEVIAEVAGFGANEAGQLGTGTASVPALAWPVKTALEGARKVVAGGFHSLALMQDGSVRAWGEGMGGALGTGSTANSALPQVVAGLPATRDVDAQANYSIALSLDGSVYSWGGAPNRLTPVPVAGLSGIQAIAAGNAHYVVLLADGTVRSVSVTGSELQDPGLTEVVAIAAGAGYSVALRADGMAWGWGQASEALPPMGPSPALLLSTPVTKLGRGGSSLIAADGTAWRFVPGTGRQFFKKIPDLDRVVALDISNAHGIALRDDGTVRIWRERYWYSGTGSNTLVDIEFNPPPSIVPAVTKATGVSQGASHTLVTREP